MKLEKVIKLLLLTLPAILFWVFFFNLFTSGHHIELLYVAFFFIVSFILFITSLIFYLIKKRAIVWWISTAVNATPMILFIGFSILTASI